MVTPQRASTRDKDGDRQRALFFTPGFFVALFLVPLWILIVSIIGIGNARTGGAAPA